MFTHCVLWLLLSTLALHKPCTWSGDAGKRELSIEGLPVSITKKSIKEIGIFELMVEGDMVEELFLLELQTKLHSFFSGWNRVDTLTVHEYSTCVKPYAEYVYMCW